MQPRCVRLCPHLSPSEGGIYSLLRGDSFFYRGGICSFKSFYFYVFIEGGLIFY